VTERRGPLNWWLRLLQAHRERRSDGVARPERRSAGVSYSDLVGARHNLSKPRFYSPEFLREEHFRASNPRHAGYVSSLEADFARVRRVPASPARAIPDRPAVAHPPSSR
jgi:hypothetical protein